MLQKFINYAKLMRLHKPIGIWLLLWPMLWALWLASAGKPDLKVLLILVLGTIIMRSAGCVINDIADRHFDGYVARTKDRPLVIGTITVKEAYSLFIALCLMALLLVLQLNTYTIKLSLIALLLAIVYPFTKRITYWPQVILGMAFAWAVPMAFTAQLEHIPAFAWLLYLIAVLWPLSYDTMYAIDDRPDDLKIGIKSTAILFGKNDRLIIAIIQIVILILLILVGLLLKLNCYYYGSLVIVIGMMAYQHKLLKKQIAPYGLLAFRNNNWVGLIIFLGIFLSYF